MTVDLRVGCYIQDDITQVEKQIQGQYQRSFRRAKSFGPVAAFFGPARRFRPVIEVEPDA
ncbi:MAG: hypothetical protein MZV65_11945 [Chromatiales bacterium]|nr:hypothetical protein [Chromatiales bacterium]